MKKIIAVVLCFFTIFSTTIIAYADSIQLYYNNVDSANTNFTISSSGLATVKNTYLGTTQTTKSAKIVTKVQKKVGLIWVTVDGGSWTDNSTAVSFSKNHSVQLSSEGTYRAHVVFTISGTGGSDDKITNKIKKKYS